jgi:Class II flagellar assembly regulator
MKINGTPPQVTATSLGNRLKSEPGFGLGGAQALSGSPQAKAAAAASGLLGMDAILALQGDEDVLTGRRRRQIRRAHDILDGLVALKLSHLSDTMDGAALIKLKDQIAQSREDIDDEGLASILNEIETRALVELAKRRMM